jgi:hypothetical protein
MNQIIITYDPDTANDGEPIDLLCYLINELENAGIDAYLREEEGVVG